jgi:DnaK suppressor protein
VVYVKRKELNVFKKELIKAKTVLLQSLSPNMSPSPKTGDPEGGDVCDIASSDRERELTLRLSERERTKLRAIEDALERIKDGTFDECEDCGSRIPIGRLRAMPFTTVCVKCQSDKEKKSKLYSNEFDITLSRDQSYSDFSKEDED